MFDNENEINFISLPIYKKGEEIFDVIREICELIPEENEHLQHVKAEMYADASMLTVKIAGAESAGLYDLKMEAAAIIRKAAMDLMVKNHSLKMFGFEYVEYYQIVRDLIEEYRLLFIEWVAGFDKWDYVIDRWGLFNPPGVGPFDKDPDEDIPFRGFDGFDDDV
ncbi:MAG: hypothetical protein HC830_01395 [Bacteroidetes bacterium]|nr:hypothetical protein [Bacteroidales bacterium]NJO68091.1 hypothetical protein [Bacteroidota bacterium]